MTLSALLRRRSQSEADMPDGKTTAEVAERLSMLAEQLSTASAELTKMVGDLRQDTQGDRDEHRK